MDFPAPSLASAHGLRQRAALLACCLQMATAAIPASPCLPNPAVSARETAISMHEWSAWLSSQYSEEMAWLATSEGASFVTWPYWKNTIWPQWSPADSQVKVSAQDSFRFLDINGDGQLTKDEFVRGYELTRRPSPLPTPAATIGSQCSACLINRQSMACWRAMKRDCGACGMVQIDDLPTSTNIPRSSTRTTITLSTTTTVSQTLSGVLDTTMTPPYRRPTPVPTPRPAIAPTTPFGSTAQCPAGFYRTSNIVWGCQGASGSGAFDLLPSERKPLVSIPVGVQNLEYNCSSAVDIDLRLFDGDPNAPFIKRMIPGSDTYKGMTIRYSDNAKSKGLAVRGPVTISLYARIQNLAREESVAVCFYQYAGISPCPRIPVGCSQHNSSAAWYEVESWSCWAQNAYFNADEAWTDSAEPYTTQDFVPWHRWAAVWARWGKSKRRNAWQMALQDMDDNKDMRISKPEFTRGFARCGMSAPAAIFPAVLTGSQAGGLDQPGQPGEILQGSSTNASASSWPWLLLVLPLAVLGCGLATAILARHCLSKPRGRGVRWEEPVAVNMQGEEAIVQEGEPLLQAEAAASSVETPWQPRMILHWQPEQHEYRVTGQQYAPSGGQQYCAAAQQQYFARPPAVGLPPPPARPLSARSASMLQNYWHPVQTWMPAMMWNPVQTWMPPAQGYHGPASRVPGL